MSPRVSKQIKLTDDEVSELDTLFNNSAWKILKDFTDSILREFLEKNESCIEFLIPSKSGVYRTIWVDNEIAYRLKPYSKCNDVSENAVIYTAIKRKLISGHSKEAQNA
ncbi:hypothetical protein [Thalassotalea marina]|uniref:Uncharacterized protein n=1 Tax=Thalassotalea marina TaxID=1673741 RepID=A0A919BR70_9GAMM|nr:hypothetical protein [Thalassotalea marina]GHG07033.1 hypothetical protein GCM10017161_40820 [Thalassotalea marina]